jgi:hypothetical protein
MESSNVDLACRRTDEPKQAFAHSPNAGIGKCQTQDTRGWRIGTIEDIGDTEREHLRLPCTGACNHHYWTVDSIDSFTLGWIERLVCGIKWTMFLHKVILAQAGTMRSDAYFGLRPPLLQ